MESKFIEINKNEWARAEEFQAFSVSPCSFSVTAEVEMTRLYEYAKTNGKKIYPLLVALTARIINEHEEFRYYEYLDDGRFGYFDVLHPLVFDLNEQGNNIKVLAAEYDNDLKTQLEKIEKVREEYKRSNGYMPQKNLPPNVVNISCVPWVKFTDLSFSLTYGAKYYFPIITFGKFEKRRNKIFIPVSVYLNHAVNDGFHASIVFKELEKKINGLI